MQLCFFTDEHSKNFHPLTLTRPVFELRVGILTIKQKWEKSLSVPFTSGLFDDYLSKLFPTQDIKDSEDCIWINSRFLPTSELVDLISKLSINESIEQSGEKIAYKARGKDSKEILSSKSFQSISFSESEASESLVSIKFLWDLLSLNGQEIKNDLNLVSSNSILNSYFEYPPITKNPENIFIGDNVTIEPGCILMADKGPIYIGDGAVIEAGSIIKGPAAICKNATVKMKARIYDSTTVGPYCKVGGEVSNSIFHSFSNKGHDGYVGNSLIGQWCNLGADTNTSNLKNNYSQVKLLDWSTKEPYEEGVQFFGTVMGDHSKAAINTMLNTGTTCGVSSNIFSSGFPPKYIPSFAWMSETNIETYNFEKAIQTMKAVMKRRGVELTDEYKEMMLFIATSNKLS